MSNYAPINGVDCRSTTIQGSPATGKSSDDAWLAMEDISAKALLAGYGYEWTGTALVAEVGGKTPKVRGLGLLLT